ncbi:hypothetical protein PFISCL1PPCAC_25136, partial [Pristionchus fissidentatus]
EGHAVATCVVKDSKGNSRTEFCPITDGNDRLLTGPTRDDKFFGPRSVGCMVIWRDSLVIKQGCHTGQDFLLEEQCQREACISNDRNSPTNFCCCFGPLCNQEYIEG